MCIRDSAKGAAAHCAAMQAPNVEPSAPAAGPLAGLKVLELGQLIAGPFAAKTLADFGVLRHANARVVPGDGSGQAPQCVLRGLQIEVMGGGWSYCPGWVP